MSAEKPPRQIFVSSGARPQPQQVAQRVGALRSLIKQRGMCAWLLPSGDSHHSEFVAPHRRRIEALSGFSGSAGDIMVGLEEAHLWVDSRYHLQAEQEVSSDWFQLHKVGLQGVQPWWVWLEKDFAVRHKGGKIGCDAFQFSIHRVHLLREALKSSGCQLEALEENLVDAVWGTKRVSGKPLRALADVYSGHPAEEKLALLRHEMQQVGADALVVSKLDQLAWSLNLRGGDVLHNPVFEGWLLVTLAEAICFTDAHVPQALAQQTDSWLRFEAYGALREHLQQLAKRGSVVWLEEAYSSQALRSMLQGATLLHHPAPPLQKWKAVKNPSEIACAQQAHLCAGAAKVRALARLEAALAQGVVVSEADMAEMLAEEYAQEADFESLSFQTLCAYGANAAIVHYAQPSKQVLLQPGGLLLLDSGIHLGGATTDDTRTIAIGTPSEEQRQCYTGVLRAHIRLALQHFPQNTPGNALDAVARSALWNIGQDYGHGTGHGVGAMLHVHEGPYGIAPTTKTPLEAGMIISIEPGCYRAGWGGVRLENLYLVEAALGMLEHLSGGSWLKFTPLTMLPFDKKLINWQALYPEEQAWLKGYHQLVLERLHLTDTPRSWLEQACQGFL